MGRPLPSALSAALDASLMQGVLGEEIRAVLGSTVSVRRVTCEILRRATIRYEVELAGGPLSIWRMVGKVYETRADGESACATLRWLWKSDFPGRPPVRVTIPRVLWFLPELELLLMEEAGGESLHRRLKRGRACKEDLRRFAEALVKLHRFPVQHVAPFTVDRHDAQCCGGLLGPLAHAFPELDEPIARIVATAREIEQDLLPGYTLAHGDYHPGQVHIDAGRCWLLDLDLLVRRDPAYDVAMVVLRLKGLGARKGAEESYRELLGVFLESYFSRMDAAIADRVPLNAALIFLKRACKRFLYRDEPDWPAAVRFQVRQAAECLTAHESLPSGRDLPEVLERCTGCPGAA